MKQGEEGFTFIEIVMVIAIIALIAGAATMVTFQLVRGTERSNDHMTAINQVQNAGYWISRDAQMAENVTTDGNFLTLSWGEEEESVYQYQVIYTLEVMPGIELKKLQRHLSIYGVPDSTTFVAQYIDPDPGRTKCVWWEEDGRLVLTVTANVSTYSQTREYVVVPRPKL